MRAWMKKCAALALCAALCLGLAACGENPPPSSASGGSALGFEDEEAPDYNLITGQPLAEGMAVGQRPVAVMVRAERAGWPQSGLAGADALVEMATQGGHTALMALYANAAALPQVGPVGPLWDQHLQLAMAMDAVCVHIGGSVYAENLLNAKSYQDVDGKYVGTQSFVFMTERKAYGNEFSWYVNAEGLAAGMGTVGLDASKGSNVPFLRFAKAPFTPAGGDAPEVAFQFSEQCPVRLVYDEAGGAYLKEAYGEAHKDGETQLAFQNVLVLFSETGEKPDDTGAVDYLFGTGQGWYCCGGKYVPVTWSKESEQAPLELFDESGAALRVNTGKTYLAFVPAAQLGTLNLAQAEQPASSAPEGGSGSASSSAPAA